MIVSTLWEVCDENSLRLDTSYVALLRDRREQLKERILVEGCCPSVMGAIETISFEDKAGTHASWTD